MGWLTLRVTHEIVLLAWHAAAVALLRRLWVKGLVILLSSVCLLRTQRLREFVLNCSHLIQETIALIIIQI